MEKLKLRVIPAWSDNNYFKVEYMNDNNEWKSILESYCPSSQYSYTRNGDMSIKTFSDFDQAVLYAKSLKTLDEIIEDQENERRKVTEFNEALRLEIESKYKVWYSEDEIPDDESQFEDDFDSN